MTEHNVNVNHNYNYPTPQRKLGFLGFLGVLLVIGAIISKPLIFGPLTAVVVAIAILAWASKSRASEKGNGT